MPTAFVLVNTEVGSELDVLRKLNKIEGIEAFALYGVYDIIVQVHSESMERLKQTITWNIRKLNNIQTTVTMIVDVNNSVTLREQKSATFKRKAEKP
jgi:DNA-binding Lrp family transcriptional regulator